MRISAFLPDSPYRNKTAVGIVIGALCCTTALGQGAVMRPEHITGRLLVQHRAGANSAQDESELLRVNATVRRRLEHLRLSILEVPEGAAEQIASKLAATGKFTFVERDFTARGTILSNDPSSASQWHLTTIGAPSAWNYSTGATSVPVAVIDSGVDSTHPDLQGKTVSGWNFLAENSDTSDVHGHGTAVAGTIAAATNNGIGVAGVTWQNPIMPLVVLNSSDYAAYSDVADAIVYGADHGVRIINISLGGTAQSSTLQSAVDYAWNKGVLIFAAAGNESSSTPTYPGACTHVVAVSATESDDTLSSFSNFGSWVSLAAPGDSILTTKRGGTYASYAGTSFASPIAAGVAALVLSVRPALDRDSVLRILEQNTDDLGSASFDTQFGWGRVNAAKAVAAAVAIAPDLAAPSVSIGAPAPSTIVSGLVAVTGTASDNVGVTGCDLYVDNTYVAHGATPFTFVWDSETVGNGSHNISVRCTDASSNLGQSNVAIFVSNPVFADAQAPAIAITSPVGGSMVAGQVCISASATDNVGVSQVSLYIDDVQVASCATSVCTYVWNSRVAAWGAHTVTARAWDGAGNSATSSVSVVR